MALQERIINKMPLPFRPDSVYSDLNEFDNKVTEYCHSSKLDKSNKTDVRSSKVIIIGDMGCGKTSLVQRFVKNSFNRDYKSTIGVDFEVEQFEILKMPFNLQVWDTAGQERFKCIASGAQAIVVAFDLMDRKSLFNSEKWLIDALKVIKYDEQAPRIFLIGTKKDLLDTLFDAKKIETHLLASDLATRLNAEYWPASSLTGENVNQFFFRLASILFDDSIKRELEDVVESKRTIGRISSQIQINNSKEYNKIINHKNLESLISNNLKCC